MNYFSPSLITGSTCLLLLFLASCQLADTPAPENTYLFLGHPYDWQSENRIDPRLELLDYNRFTGVWLGGDVCARTSKDVNTLTYLDSLFDLKSAATHWSWGNHDLLEGNEQLLLDATGRDDYYTENLNGLQLIVLNTNLFWHYEWSPPQEECERKDAQIEWLQYVLDTINSASHLVVLHHHGLLNEFKNKDQSWGNLETSPVRFNCDAHSDFTATFYANLIRIRKKGIPVVMISGDVGMLSKSYELRTPEEIDLLGSGINNSLDMAYPPDYVTNFNPDSVLVLKHKPATQELDWSFVRLSDVVLEHLEEDHYQQLGPVLKNLLKVY